MVKIYLTYRANDTSQDELPMIIKQLEEVFGKENITVSKADPEADIFELYKLVQTHDALLVLIGQRFTTFVDDYGRPLLDSAYDYLYNEMLSSLEKDDMWISTLLTDNAKMPDENQLPENLSEIIRRDSLKLYNPATLHQDIQVLSKRLGILGKEKQSSLVKIVHIPTSEVNQPDETTGLILLVIMFVIIGLCYFSVFLFENCFHFVNQMTC